MTQLALYRVLPRIVPCIVMLAGCSSPTAPTPAPLPAAVLTFRGALTFPGCIGGLCSYEAEAINNGPGCATNVRGVTRFFNSAGTQTAIDEWALPPARKLRPQEIFLYGDTYAIRLEDVQGMNRSYDTTFSWDNTPC